MPVEELTCPNCGAAVQFAAHTAEATCKYCNSTLRLTTHLVAQPPKPQTPDASVDPYRSLADMDRIKQLLSKGKRREAVRLYMEQTGSSLLEARTVIADVWFELTGVHVPVSDEVDLEPARQLILDGNKLNAIKLIREQTGLGLKEAKDIADDLERGGTPIVPPRPETTPRFRPRQSMSRATQSNGCVGCLLGLLPVVAMIGVCMLSMGVLGQIMFRAFGPYNQAMDIISASPEVADVFGSPITTGLFMFGGIGWDGNSADAGFEVPIFAPRRNGNLNVSGHYRRGVWDVSVWLTYDDGGEELTIFLSDQRK